MKNESMPKDTTELFIKEYLELKDENRYLKDLCERDEALANDESERSAELDTILCDVIRLFDIHWDDGSLKAGNADVSAGSMEAQRIIGYIADKFRGPEPPYQKADSHGGRE